MMSPDRAVAPSSRSRAAMPGVTIFRAMMKITTSTAAAAR